jgi:hypothetical protein
MTSLQDLVRMATSALISPIELIDALENLAFGNRDFGYVEVRQVIALFDRCNPAMSRDNLIRVRDICRAGSKGLQGTGKANAASEYAQVADAAEARAVKMP